MSTTNNEQHDILMQEQNNYDWMRRRQANYPQFSDEDVGHIYDSITAIINALESSNIPVILNDNTKARLEHRKLIKAAIPKN